MNKFATEKFTAFITNAAEKLAGKINNTLISYHFEADGFHFNEKVNTLSKSFEKFFYWEKPESQFSFMGLGELFSITENGINRFSSSEKKVKNWNNNFYSNLNSSELQIPLFVGGMKFLPESEPDLWDNYPDSNWTIPRILLVKNGKTEQVFYNFIYTPDSPKEKIIEEFNRRISILNNESATVQSAHMPKILSSIGNGPKERKRWIEYVKEALEKIDSEIIKKVVLSRSVELKLDTDPNIFDFINQFRKKYPECNIFAIHSGKSTFFGASPEKLVKFHPDFVETDSLAGSAPRGKDEIEDKIIEEELLSSVKNLHEHKTVIDFIEKQFNKLNIKVTYDSIPKIKKLHNIQHLWTPIKAEVHTNGNIFNILEILHPTPAVCGVPQSSAMQVIKEMEDYSRGLYSGVVGWFNLQGEGEFTVAIRSALAKGKKIYAFAGSGIVEGSEPQSEYKETELKLKPILSLFDNENKN
ncbi:MAG: isochorismate synthase [Ignavibacteriales bacterium]|nr:isochorismate synthase [Ignavibacteriales bacterium]